MLISYNWATTGEKIIDIEYQNPVIVLNLRTGFEINYHPVNPIKSWQIDLFHNGIHLNDSDSLVSHGIVDNDIITVVLIHVNEDDVFDVVFFTTGMNFYSYSPLPPVDVYRGMNFKMLKKIMEHQWGRKISNVVFDAHVELDDECIVPDVFLSHETYISFYEESYRDIELRKK